jgi:hypothetical protein
MEGLRTSSSHAGGGGREGEGDPQHHFYVEENRSRQSALRVSALILQYPRGNESYADPGLLPVVDVGSLTILHMSICLHCFPTSPHSRYLHHMARGVAARVMHGDKD